ncbi:MAG: DNA translocase FtsK, partial [Paludibacteraceae bacterium]|nr:DNA translocase FtsK [Paludibacteraceae bacterium]
NPKIVSMHATIASKKFQEAKMELPVALGRTITNEVFMFDLAKAPHLLVAGATGQGKSVGLNAIITSLLYKKHPSQLKFVLVDPKMVEFSMYRKIDKHFLAQIPDAETPVITDTSLVLSTLNSLVQEMEDRYKLLMDANVRNIKEYNEKFINRRLNPYKGHKYLPYLVIIIDEFGDFIMTAGKEVETPIARIAQKARAVGMHLILATQRPSVNIITGVIKANFPARMAFKVSSGIDSKTILDQSGAQQLIGRGDLLYLQGDSPVRVQCAFVDTPEVENVVEYISEQQGYPAPFELPEPPMPEGENKDLSGIDLSKKDPYFEEVARFVVTSQMGSTSYIQRKYNIGFNRAGRIMDQLEVAGIVGPARGSKPREVLVSSEVELESMLSTM